ncbi:MAG: type II toxin-antitoxin system RatA family toxin [Wenzhouxiangella sp.]
MTEVHRFALVEYTSEQMFELVRAVPRYPEFLPWVRRAEVHEEDEQRQLASLEVALAGLRRSFTTENCLAYPHRLDIRLQSGPFEDLVGCWRFDPIGHGSRVSLDLSFRLSGSAWMLPFRRSFERMADRMVDDFCRRADRVYGRRAATG